MQRRSSVSGSECAGASAKTDSGRFHPEFIKDLRYWVKTDRKTALRVLDLVEAVLPNPFEGQGKPEALKYLLAGCWSRRITQEHRLVYRVAGETIDFLQARYHY